MMINRWHFLMSVSSWLFGSSGLFLVCNSIIQKRNADMLATFDTGNTAFMLDRKSVV